MFYHESATVTLTFKLQPWLLHLTQRLINMNICAKKFHHTVYGFNFTEAKFGGFKKNHNYYIGGD